jgi:plasmid stabilization system protein ParE
MKRDLHILPAAESDIEQCFRYLRDESSLDKAIGFLDGIQESLELIRQMPYIGSPRNLPAAHIRNMRQWPVKGFRDILIFYRAAKTASKS